MEGRGRCEREGPSVRPRLYNGGGGAYPSLKMSDIATIP